MDDLVEELQALGEHPCRAHLPFGATLRQAAAHITELETQLATAKLDSVRLGIEAAAGALKIIPIHHKAALWDANYVIRNLDPAAIIARAD